MVHDAAIRQTGVNYYSVRSSPSPKKMHDHKNFLVEMRECARHYWKSQKITPYGLIKLANKYWKTLRAIHHLYNWNSSTVKRQTLANGSIISLYCIVRIRQESDIKHFQIPVLYCGGCDSRIKVHGSRDHSLTRGCCNMIF